MATRRGEGGFTEVGRVYPDGNGNAVRVAGKPRLVINSVQNPQ